MELQDLIIEYKPNPFNENWFATMTHAASKTDYSGGMGYYYALQPATYVSGGVTQFMSGHNVRFSPSPSQWADFYWDFVYWGEDATLSTAPGGQSHLAIEEFTHDGRTVYLINVSSDGEARIGSVVAEFVLDIPSAEITEATPNGWNLVLKDADYHDVIVSGADVELDNQPYYFVGAYKMSSASSAYADALMESAEQRGFEEGLREGVATTNGNQSAFDLMGSAFSSVGGMLGVAVLPGITLGTLVAVPLIVTLLVVVVRLLKK